MSSSPLVISSVVPMVLSGGSDSDKIANSDKIAKTVNALAKLARRSVDYDATPSTYPRLALSILKEHSISKDDLKNLFSELNKIEQPTTVTAKVVDYVASSTPTDLTSAAVIYTAKVVGYVTSSTSPKKTLANWFFRLCHPSNGSGGKELYTWLIEHEISITLIQTYFDIEPKDILDFSAGFILGVGKSLIYDNIVGIPLLIGRGTIDLLNNLVQQYRENSSKSIEMAIQSSIKLQEAIMETLVDKKAYADLERITAIGSYLSEIRTIFIGFCVSPFAKLSDNGVVKFNEVFAKIISFIDEKEKVSKTLSYVNDKYQKEKKEITHLLLQYKFFEAGAVFGNLIADIAQILFGLMMLLRSTGKFVVKRGKLASIKLLKLSATNKAKAMTLLTAIYSLNPRYLKKIPVLHIDSPLIHLMVEKGEVQELATALDNGLSYFETKNIKALDGEVAESLIQATGKPALFESSVVGEPLTIIEIIGALTLFVRKRKKGKFDEHINETMRSLFKNDFRSNLYYTLLNNKEILSVENFFMEVAEAVKIKIPDNISEKEILQLFTDKCVTLFEEDILNQIKNGTVIEKEAIYSKFNSFMNKIIRPIAEEKRNQGLLILIDEPFNKLPLNGYATVVFNGKKTTVKKLFQMPIETFYETFFPEKGWKASYQNALKNLENKAPEAYAVYKERDAVLKKIEKVIQENKSFNELEDYIKLNKEYEVLTYKIQSHIETLVKEKVIDTTVESQLLMEQYGKMNPLSLCGSTRPDLLIINLIGESSLYDFVHTAQKNVPDLGHIIGVDFYDDFQMVLFGGRSNKAVTPYTFSEYFQSVIKKLRPSE